MYRMSTDYIRLPNEFKKDIETLLDIILERKDVIRVILFGSCARQRISTNKGVMKMTNCKTCEHHQYNEKGLIKCQYGHTIGTEQPKNCPSYEEI